LTQKIIDCTGPRLAGTESSKQAADMLKSEMEGFTDKSEVEEFDLYQGAFLGWIKILVISYFLSVALIWFNYSAIAFALAVLSILILVLQFFFYLPIIDKLFPKRKGYNVVGFIEPKNEVKKQIIISGHHDSAKVFNFFIHQPKLYNLRVTGSIGLVIFLLVISIPLEFIEGTTISLILKILMTIGLLLIVQMWFFASKKGTPGAGDNLIASTMALEIGRYYSNNRLKNTRIIIASFDAEEEGLRGARAFAKKHSQYFKEIPTTLLNTDCAYNLDDLFFLTSDINGTVQLDKDLAEALVEISKSSGYNCLSKPIAFLTGGTDAGEIAKIGVKATTLIGMPWSNNSRSSVYHTPNDTLDHVQPEVIDAAITIFMKYIDKE
jgi:hypothetical protein